MQTPADGLQFFLDLLKKKLQTSLKGANLSRALFFSRVSIESNLRWQQILSNLLTDMVVLKTGLAIGPSLHKFLMFSRLLLLMPSKYKIPKKAFSSTTSMGSHCTFFLA